MKKSFFKVFALPVMVAGVAVLSAFGTAKQSSSTGKVAANEIGWIRTSPGHCTESTMCNEEGLVACRVNQTASGALLYRKVGNDCTFQLYKEIPQQ